ncbi:MAG: response regulator transcription factor [Thermoleophilaceae bacterium]|nr:response regulator transcription factor [Thermoleophilaceae bacterium]
MSPAITVATGVFEDLTAIGLKTLLADEPSTELVADGVRAEDLPRMLAELAPDVAVLNFGTLPSVSVVRQLHEEHPGTRYVVIANRPSAAEANQLLAFGATACVPKDTQARDIVNALHLASRGMQIAPRPTDVESGGAELLTPREAQVLEKLQDGMTNAQIALELSIGIETVRTHARNIYAKLGVSSRRDLARLSPAGGVSPSAPLPA